MIQGEARITEEFLAALLVVHNSISLDDLAILLEQGRFDEAFRVVGRAAARLGVTASEVYVNAAQDTAGFMTREIDEVVIAFDQTNTRAVRAMQENQLRLVREFTEQQRRTTQQALVRGIEEGLNPRDQARVFRDSIGLTQRQEQWVDNYRRNLNELDRRALDRALRDRRFDRTVEAAIRDGRPIPQDRIDKMVKRYRERMLKHRSEVIARTEALRSANAGVREMYTQAIEAGELDPRQMIRIWNTAGDERVRDFSNGAQTSHASMHNQERQFGEPFTSGAGNQTLDPGSFGVASEDILCRCVVSARILTPQEAGLIGIAITETF